jgi:hypothetical protein
VCDENVLATLFFAVAICGRVDAGETQEFVTVDPEPAYYAWRLRARFHPFETEVRGIPVQKIRKNWCKAFEFRRELFPQDLQEDLKSVDFALDGFFDGSKTKQTALVGAYETCGGERGGFFLIFDWPPRTANDPVHREWSNRPSVCPSLGQARSIDHRLVLHVLRLRHGIQMGSVQTEFCCGSREILMEPHL